MIMLRSTHELRMEIERMNNKLDTHRAERAEQALKRAELVIQELRRTVKEQLQTIRGLTHTNSELTRDLVVVRGASRTRTEKTVREEPAEIAPDVLLQDETRQGLDKDHDAVEDARRELERMLDELGDPPPVSEEALAAATPNSVEDWEEEHAPA